MVNPRATTKKIIQKYLYNEKIIKRIKILQQENIHIIQKKAIKEGNSYETNRKLKVKQQT